MIIRRVSYCVIIMSTFQMQLDVSIGPMESDGYRSFHLHSLRIQLPEEIDSLLSEKERLGQTTKDPREETKQHEDGSSEDTEYVTASPRYTWSDENVRGIKQERFGELLWPMVLQKYGLTIHTSRSFSTYSAFLKSSVYRHPQRYPHQSLNGLMEWYIEEHLHILKGKQNTQAEHEELKRRCLLRKFFLRHRLAWSPEYMDVYSEWSKRCRVGMNRYQKMEAFVKNFFDV